MALRWLSSSTKTLNPQEISKFNALSHQWWDRQGPLKLLHHMNPLRLSFIESFTKLHQSQVLDIGCGAGILSEAMARKGALVTGVDAAPLNVQVAQHHASLDPDLDINYSCTLIENMKLQSHYDVVTALEVLEHVDQPLEFIQNCARTLKPSGYLFLSTINQTLLAYLGTILVAEHVLKMVPKGTRKSLIFSFQ